MARPVRVIGQNQQWIQNEGTKPHFVLTWIRCIGHDGCVCAISKTQAKWTSLDSCHVPILEETSV